MSTQDIKPDPAAALQQLLSTLEFVKVVTHLKECSKTGPALARMMTDAQHGTENIDLICTALVALQGMLGRMMVTGHEKDAEVVMPQLVAFMERLGDEHEGPSADDADPSVLH